MKQYNHIITADVTFEFHRRTEYHIFQCHFCLRPPPATTGLVVIVPCVHTSVRLSFTNDVTAPTFFFDFRYRSESGFCDANYREAALTKSPYRTFLCDSQNYDICRDRLDKCHHSKSVRFDYTGLQFGGVVKISCRWVFYGFLALFMSSYITQL